MIDRGMGWIPRTLCVVSLSRFFSTSLSTASTPPGARTDAGWCALRAVAPVRLVLAGASALALAAPAIGLVDPLAPSRLPGWSAAAAAATIAVLALVTLVATRRPAPRGIARRSHALAACDALGLALLVLHFGAPTLVVVPLLVLLPLAFAHTPSAQRVLWWTTPAFLVASELHVRVRPLDAPSLAHVWLGALGLLGLGGFAIWQARQQRAMAQAVSERIAARDTPVLAHSAPAHPSLDTHIALVGDALRPVREAVDAWLWAEQARAMARGVHDREHAAVRTQLAVALDALRDRATESAREADLLHDGLVQSARTVTDGARTARAARAAGELAASSADAAGELARRLAHSAQLGRDAVERLARTLRLVSDEVPRVTDDARTLGPLTDDVGHAVHALERLVRQSAQVALNASIEAQRAGPYGIGFSVVADELQRLATQTASAANRIAETVSDARDTVHALTRRLERSARATDAVEQITTASHSALETLLADVTLLLDRSDATMRQTRAQADAAAGALLALDGLDERVQHAARDARRAALALSTHATDLHALRQAVQQLASMSVTPTRHDGPLTRTPRSSAALPTPARAQPAVASRPPATHRDVA